MLSGSATEVSLAPHLPLLQPGGSYLALHTHLSSASFSDYDAAVLLVNDPIHTIAAVGADGTWYVLSKVQGRPAPDPVVVVALLHRSLLIALPRYRRRVEAGTMTEDRARRRLLHEAWRGIAPRVRLRHDRCW